MDPADDRSFGLADIGASWAGHRFVDPTALDEGTASRILDGLGPADMPPGYVGLANLVAAATAPAVADELESEATVIAAFVGESASTAELSLPTIELPSQSSATGSRPRLVSRFATPRVAAAVVASCVALGGGVAAAATGSLPGAAQDVAAHVLGLVGVDVPGPNGHAVGHPDIRGGSGAPPTTTLTPRGQAGRGSTACPPLCGGQVLPGTSTPPGAGGSGAAASPPSHGGAATPSPASRGAGLSGTGKAGNAGGDVGNAGSHARAANANGSSEGQRHAHRLR